jgi:hypothetical protein
MHRDYRLDIVAIPCLAIRGDLLLQRMLGTHGILRKISRSIGPSSMVMGDVTFYMLLATRTRCG